jgi:glutathione S-transferase
MLWVHRIPFSTNVERVALAAGHKGLAVEWVDHSPGDRSAVRALSGQDLVPVAEIDGEVVVDSMRIVARLEEIEPEPRLYPADPAARARIEVFIGWFNEVWKRPPNEIDAELRRDRPDGSAIDAAAVRIRGWLEMFERLLAGRDHLMGDEFGAADVCAFPFLKYADSAQLDPADDETFHRVLVDHLRIDNAYPRLRAWIRRVDRLPRA